VPQIEVTFDIDANGILHVSAKDLGTGKEQKISITPSSGLTKEEIERMRKEAEAHAEEDRKKREAAEARNEADNAVYRTEKLLRESGDKLGASEKAAIERAVAQVKDALKGDDTAAIKAATEKLTEAWQRASETLYRAAAEKARARQAAGAQESGGKRADTKSSAGKDEGPIIDAEVVDDKK